MKKIVLAIDSFKGSLSSQEISACVRSGILSVFPDCEVVIVPMADGGEGTATAIAEALTGKCRSFTSDTVDPLGRDMNAEFYIDCTTAYMDLASASGLTLLKKREQNPLHTSTLGTGIMMLDAIKEGCTKIVLGVGGSATNDAGIGILTALGFRFYNKYGTLLPPIGENLKNIAFVDKNDSVWNTAIRLEILADVTNPFLGDNGAVATFSFQKGASVGDAIELESGMEIFAKITKKSTDIEMNSIRGGGAAGGVAAGCVAYLGAEMRSGIDFILDITKFNDIIADADLVITGEGKIDGQTAGGKVISGVTKRAGEQGIPVIALAGCVDKDIDTASLGLKGAYSINPEGTPIEEAMKKTVAKANAKSAIEYILKKFL